MPTLLQINVTCNWGSTGRIAEQIGEIAIADGWTSYIAYGRGKPSSKSNIIRIGNDLDMYIHGLKSHVFDNHGLNSISITNRFIKKIDEIKPDIIHLHNIHGYYINYEILFKYLFEKGIHVVWTLHDCWSFTGHCAYFTYNKCNDWQHNECIHCLHKKEYPTSWMLNNSHSNFLRKRKAFSSLKKASIVTVSNWLKDIVENTFLNKYKPICLHNGINTEIFKAQNDLQQIREKYNVKQPYIILGVASIWEKRKGLADFIKLRERLPIEDFAIVLVGINEKQGRNLPSGIVQIRRTEDINELASLYSSANVFVNPTWEDNFPTTNLESLACGTPVITYGTGGSPEAIDTHTGIVVETGNIIELTQAVKKICGIPKERITDSCRRRACNLYDMRKNCKKYIRLYNKLLEE